MRGPIHDLEADYLLKVIKLVCKNPDCPQSLQRAKQEERDPLIYIPEELDRFAVPKRHLTWVLLYELGYLRFEMRLDIASIQTLLELNYGLRLPSQTLIDWCDLYEAACLAWHTKHPDKLKKALGALSEVVYLIDFTEDTTKDPVLRVFVAGLGLGLITRVIPNADNEATAKVLKELDKLYGVPGLIVCDDDKAIKVACATVWPNTPIQDCFEHLFRRITKKLLGPSRQKAQTILQKYKYQKKLKQLLTHLEAKMKGSWPEHGEDLRQLFEYLLKQPPGGDHTKPRPLQKLQDFEAAWTHLNYLFKVIQGHKPQKGRLFPELKALRELKEALAEDEPFQGLKDKRLLADPFYHALLQVKELVDAIHSDSRTSATLHNWRFAQKELQRLQGWLWALKLHRFKRNAKIQQGGLTPAQQKEFKRLRGLFKRLTAHQRRELRPLTGPSLTVPTVAAAFLQKLIKQWREKGETLAPFQKAAAQLKKASPNLLHFLRFQWAPPSQQELESQNNRLKQVFRQQSGHVATRHRLVYHAESYSAALNFHSKTGELSPLERLGIDLGPDSKWFTGLSWTDLREAWLHLQKLRQPRRDYLAIKKQGLSKIREKSPQIWARIVYQRLQSR